MEPARDADMLRHGDRWVRVSGELVKTLSAEWSEPLRVCITSEEGDVLDLTFQTHSCEGAQA